MSKLDLMEAYPRGTLHLSKVGSFTYIVPSETDDNYTIIYINLVHVIGLVNSPKFFWDC